MKIPTLRMHHVACYRSCNYCSVITGEIDLSILNVVLLVLISTIKITLFRECCQFRTAIYFCALGCRAIADKRPLCFQIALGLYCDSSLIFLTKIPRDITLNISIFICLNDDVVIQKRGI
jgi:hypothetical protein